ncbi:MAG: hypothetical protein WBC11_01095, partial [Dehalococcoidia bacterium]
PLLEGVIRVKGVMPDAADYALIYGKFQDVILTDSSRVFKHIGQRVEVGAFRWECSFKRRIVDNL